MDIQTLATAADGLNFPRDLAFHPHRSRKELWVINREVEADGGSTLTLFDAGEEDQSSLWRRDGNAYHFMALPTALDFGVEMETGHLPPVYLMQIMRGVVIQGLLYGLVIHRFTQS